MPHPYDLENDVELRRLYNSKKPMLKAEVMKLRPGDFIVVKWLDHTDTVHMVTRKPERERGDVDVEIWSDPSDPKVSHILSTCIHSQVLRKVGQVQFPKL